MRLLSLAVAALVVVTLTGCVPSESPPKPTPSPTATPFFATEEEALAAAEEAYAAYSEITSQLLGDPSSDPMLLESVVTGGLLTAEKESLQEARENGLRFVGKSVIRSIEIQSFEQSGEVSIYVCEELESTDVLDPSGKSIVSPTRSPESTFLAAFVPVEGLLRMSERELWSETC